ncbi:hypothetical protein KO561_03775 [Radiobacillus kanasensis]|uniref:hypothetical protein n=1 Tax=Radiobacillus kanasensis TaxID=2844358 RepID=UPI001E41288B|nr:hypothetical protein [Radiobacillus kanasensis]UFU00094.1 hypothetical protein KO561_03775 [Radiobacillus kanasensis]
MATFSWMIFIWQSALVLSIFTFLFGIFKKSWISLLISSVASLPIAYYFYGAENCWRIISLLPVLLGGLAFIFWRNYKVNV